MPGIYSAYGAGRPIMRGGTTAQVKTPPHPLDRAERMLSSAGGIYSDLAASERAYRMLPQKTIGGALMGGASMGLLTGQAGAALVEAGAAGSTTAAAGAAMGSLPGMAIGFGLGMMAYLMS